MVPWKIWHHWEFLTEVFCSESIRQATRIQFPYCKVWIILNRQILSCHQIPEVRWMWPWLYEFVKQTLQRQLRWKSRIQTSALVFKPESKPGALTLHEAEVYLEDLDGTSRRSEQLSPKGRTSWSGYCAGIIHSAAWKRAISWKKNYLLRHFTINNIIPNPPNTWGISSSSLEAFLNL